tara:strand:- start:378 stop:692 length:315 start_codon:yes stop_codon:yes gene_type:complete
MVKQITVQTLNRQLDKNKIHLLDVREEFELNICSIKGSIHIPMQQIGNRLNELSGQLEYAVICHSGVRSHHTCEFLYKKGFIVYNVIGGIDEWALSIDNDMQRY